MPWEGYYQGPVNGLTAEQFAAKQRLLGLEDVPWTPTEMALPGAEDYAPSTKSLVPVRQALRPLPAEEDTTWGPTPTGKAANVGGFLPGYGGGYGSGGGFDWGSFGRGALDVLGDIFGDDPYTPGGFMPGPAPDPELPTLPLPPTWGYGTPRGVIVRGNVVFDACGRCFIERTLPPRVVRRRGRIVMGPNGQPACMPMPRRMNALNPRALNRALKRAKAFAKFAKKAVRIQQTFKGGRPLPFRRKRKAKTCAPCRS